MSQPANIPPVLIDYFAQREADRLDAVTQALGALTERERLLVKEAAVMGWVQGIRHHDQKMPGDRQVLYTVVDACLSFSDLYPTISGHTTDED